MKHIIIFLISIILISNSFSQNKEVRDLLTQANQKFTERNYNEALNLLEQAQQLDNKNADVYFAFGTIYREMNMYGSMAVKYKQACDEIGKERPEFYLMLGGVQVQQEKYEEAKQTFTEYLKYAPKDSKYIKQVERNIAVCDFAKEAIKNPVPFNPINLGSGVNSKLDEYLPALNVEENELVYTRKVVNEYPKYLGDEFQEDFYVSAKNGETWGDSDALRGYINTDDNEGAQTLSSDGKYLFFSACNRDDGLGGCDIYFSKRVNGNWVKPMNLGAPLNTEHWDSHPSIAPDGKTLYFSSDRPGGFGKQDIWVCTIQNNGKFSEPVNLGSKINTAGGEVFPFIHCDNKTLYFTSGGHPGMGGYDNFVSKKENGEWGIPKNLGYPINTYGNESSLIVNAKGNTAYFSSDKRGGKGGIDIYKFDIYDEIKPQSITYLKGVIKDSESKALLSAKFELYNIETGELIKSAYSSSKTGEFFILVPTNVNYLINVEKDDYIFYSDNFSLKNSDNKEKIFVKNIELQAIKSGNKVTLKNIFFETNSFKLKDESKTELQKLLSFMKKYPELKIQIEGYTDNVGDEAANQILSENRAKAVKQFLSKNGITETRITYKGFGEKNPIADNGTEKGRAENRRTEFSIVGVE